MLDDVIQPFSSASNVARFTECAMPRSSAWTTSSRVSAGYPSRSWTVRLSGCASPRRASKIPMHATPTSVIDCRMAPPRTSPSVFENLCAQLLPQPLMRLHRRHEQTAPQRRFLVELGQDGRGGRRYDPRGDASDVVHQLGSLREQRATQDDEGGIEHDAQVCGR